MDRLISEMKKEERSKAIEYLKSYRTLDENLHNMAPLNSVSYYATDICLKYWDMAIKVLAILPAEPKTGHWIEEDMFDGDVVYRCSECNELIWIEDGTPKDNGYNFCPKCGARMVEPQESDDKK